MPDLTNPFDIFKVIEIVAAVNVQPNKYGLLNAKNLMPIKGVMTDTIAVEMKNGVLTLIPIEKEDGPGSVGKGGKRNVRYFEIPRLPYDEHISPKDIRNARAFGGDQRIQMATVLNDKLDDARAKHDITLEHLRMTALKGQIMDADGTIIYDLFDEFDITPKVFAFDFSAGADVRKQCLDLKRYIEKNALGEVITGVSVLVDGGFYDALTGHASVKEAFTNWQAASDRLAGDMRSGFTFGGVTFEEYAGSATAPDGTVRQFIGEDEGHAYPTGTINTFKTWVGPSDFNETVNRLGRPYYAKVIEAKFGRGYDAHTQSNVLPMCNRPALLPKLTIA